MKTSTVHSPQSTVRRDAQRGIALVITLIMLAIITFMAVTFLVLSQRELSSVNGATDQKIARNASDTALARVTSEMLTRMLLNTNFQDMGLIVSTNYINAAGLFNGTPGTLSPTNVNYDYLVGGSTAFTAQDRNINIASLLYNARVPVFVETNVGTHAGEFRYYLDLNRNGRDDKNGSWPVIVNDATGNPAYVSTNAAGQMITVATNPPPKGWILTNDFVGDPEWIGVFERPEELHSVDNRAIARYAYCVIPMSQTLDVNTMHNRAKRPLIPTVDGFLRNQGVGPWEENLAAFLADLNTNAWWNSFNYFYNTNSGSVSTGSAFTNANDILTYRYGGSYTTLPTANTLLPGPALGTKLASYGIDFYSDGPLMLGTTNNSTGDNPTMPWSGGDNTNHFFSSQDLFSQMPPGFRTTLSNLGTSNDSYNAYTYYRMLAQLGTDSAPDRGKLNVNFKNTDLSGNIIPGMETNLIAWSALDFFTNAAAAMFRQMNMLDLNSNLITITNIPIYEDPTRYNGTNINYYSPAVHRVLQLAANIFDATTNRFVNGGPTNYPSVFRPLFESQNGIAYIAGYTEVGDVSAVNPALDFQYVNAQAFASADHPLSAGLNINGVPWVIGAKKGFPNFNEFAMENQLAVSRKIAFTNATSSQGPPWTTNQLFDLAVTNTFNMNAWNSYTNTFGRSLRLVVSNEVSIVITNQTGFSLLQATNLSFGNDLTLSSWTGWQLRAFPLLDNSFIIPMAGSIQYTNGTYGQTFFLPLSPPRWDVTFVPRLWMALQFKTKFIMIDTTSHRIVDFVNLFSVQPVVDITSNLQVNLSNPGQIWQFPDQSDFNAQWDTNLFHGIQKGLWNQISVSMNDVADIWVDPIPGDRTSQINTFNGFLNNGGTNYFQAPYTPSQIIYQRVTYEANDPLVHYTMQDLTSTNGSGLAFYNGVYLNAKNPGLANTNNLNFAYQPWGGCHYPSGGSDLNPNPPFTTDYRVKDSKMEQSDNWDFPTNKLPNIGWLGRVHRGTPWQTIDLKPSTIAVKDWVTWANDNVVYGSGNDARLDASLTHPTNDYSLFDIFTTAVNDNASAGRLNVNQTNLAAWSAILSGVNVLSNAPAGPAPWVISPAGVINPTNRTAVAVMMDGINATRANTNPAVGPVFQNGYFQHAGDVLATPQLTIESPFIDTNVISGNPFRKGLNTVFANGVNDEMMERIPQQVMSLLTLNQTPRFVIYSYGQTLHPADHSLVVGGSFNGLCTNYQITAESATRAVVRVEGTPDPQYVDGKVDTLGRSYPPHIVVEQFNVLGPD